MHIEHDGARLFYTTLGEGPDVVLLHPTPTHHAFWLPAAHLLADRYRLTLVDLRGHGQSTLGTGPIAMEKLAGDVHSVLQASAVTRAAFVGCSIGSYLLYEYWRRFPQQIAALVFTCGKPQPDTQVNRDRRHEWMHSAREPGGLAKFFDLMAETLVGPTAFKNYPNIRTAARAMMDAVHLDAMLAIQQGLMQRPDSVPTLTTIHVPVLAIAGGEDQSSTPHEMQVIATHVPAAEFRLVPDAGHFAPWEQPEHIASLIGGFLDQHYRPTATGSSPLSGLSH